MSLLRRRLSYTCPSGCWSEYGKCVCPDDLGPSLRGGLGLVPHAFDMITPSWSPMGPVATQPQLEGPWAVARGQELPSVFTPAAKTLLTLGSAALCAYHGTRRNGGSIFWGTVWFGLGALFPVVTPIFAFGQGVGECANNCRREPTERR